MKIYLASPLFTDDERKLVNAAAKILRIMNHDVYVPMEHTVENAWNLPNHVWARKVFEEDIAAIDNSDLVIAIYYGLYSDSGTAWECGYAYAKNIPVYVMPITEKKVSLMVVNGAINKEQFTEYNQT